MTSDELISAISEVVGQIDDVDLELENLVRVFNVHAVRQLDVLRDLIEEIKHLRYAVDRVGR